MKKELPQSMEEAYFLGPDLAAVLFALQQKKKKNSEKNRKNRLTEINISGTITNASESRKFWRHQLHTEK